MGVVNVRVAPMVVSSSPTAMAKKVAIVHFVKRFASKEEARFYEMGTECRVATWCGRGMDYGQGTHLEAFPVRVYRNATRPCLRCRSAANFDTYHVELEPPIFDWTYDMLVSTKRRSGSILYDNQQKVVDN